MKRIHLLLTFLAATLPTSAAPLVAQAIEDPYEQILAMRRQMFTLRRDNRLDEAIPVAQRVLMAEQRIYGDEHAFVAQTLGFLADLFEADGQTKKAQETCRRLEAVEQKLDADRKRRLDELERRAREAIKLASDGDLAKAEGMLAGNLSRAFNLLDFAAKTQPEHAQIDLARSLRVHLDRYLTLASLRNTARPAYASVSNWKGATLIRQRRMNLERKNRSLAPLYAELDKTQVRISDLIVAGKADQETKQKLAQLNNTKQRLEAEIARRRYSLPQYMPPPVEWILPKGTVLFDYYQYSVTDRPNDEQDAIAGEQRLAVFVVRSQQSADEPVIHVDLGPVEAIEKAILAWRGNIRHGGGAVRGDRRVRPNVAPAKPKTLPQLKLRELIWTPLASYLKDDATVLISPDGVLASVPFNALPATSKDKYLIEERAIALAPAPRLIERLKSLASLGQPNAKPDAKRRGMLLVGDVDFDATRDETNSKQALSSFSFRRLPGTRREVTAIEGLFGEFQVGEDVKVLSGAQATEIAFRRASTKPKYLHLATHGFFQRALDDATANGKADTSGSVTHLAAQVGLALAGANVATPVELDDGILTALDVAALDLNGVELAVLSACDTGLGKSLVGEGVLGLQRAFQVAGCRSTITSLWRVHDEATQALMVEFYRNLWTKKFGKLEALRQAQLAMLRGKLYTPPSWKKNKSSGPSHLAPTYWAAFSLSGNAR